MVNSLFNSDCEQCYGLCCVALPYAKSADFKWNKESGVPCPNLGEDHRCGIHDKLRAEGFQGRTTCLEGTLPRFPLERER